MKIEISACSFQGGREYNEDTVKFLQMDDTAVVVVADGLGGHGGGQIASSIVADVITRSFMNERAMKPDSIRKIYEYANTEVVKAQTQAVKMKSTGVAVFLKNNAIIYGHAGDSRFYHFINGVLAFQTLDHSVSQLAVLTGEITKEQIRLHDDRNKVLRAFGDDESFKAEISDMQKLGRGSHAFLLCTDGFWEYIWEAEMEIELSKVSAPDEWIKCMIQRVAQRAPQNQDNFSAAAVFITV